MTEVQFAVRLLGDASARVVCLLGSAPELGAWDVDKAVPMKLVDQQESESAWHATVAFTAATSTLEYKYVVKRLQTHGLVSWEGLPGNRTLTIARGSNVALGAPSSQSSTYTTTRAPVPGPREAKLGNNGSTNGFQEWRCCRTDKEANPWWEVDLGRDYAISSIHVWSAMTYHEQARHPDGRPPITSKASTSSPAAPLWVFVSKQPLSRETGSYQDAQAKASTDASAVRAIEVQSAFDSRVSSLDFEAGGACGEAVAGRYVRLQYAGASACSLQFAELEVITQDDAASVAGKNAPQKTVSCLKCDDGFYGVPRALDEDLRQYVESGWLNPAAKVAELQVWIGSFDSTRPAIQWLSSEPKHNRVVIEMRHERQTKGSNEAGSANGTAQQKKNTTVEWESLSVESKGAALLDKESTELRQLLEAHQQQPGTDISGYLNNDPDRPTALPSSKASWVSRLVFVQSLEASEVDLLAGKVDTHKYSQGEIILHYAEQKRAVYYVESGDVELLGPASSTGSNVIGTLTDDSFFNEMGLFGRWSKEPALFKAKTDVVLHVLDLDKILAALGNDKVYSIRDDYIRTIHKAMSSSAAANLSTVHFTDSTHAQVFRVQVPAAVVDGSWSPSNGLSHRWTFDIYSYQCDAKSKKELLGSAYLLPSQIDKHGEADLTVPILHSATGLVGQLTLSYLVLTPFSHPKNNIANVWRSYWRERPPLTIGHRGMGRSYYQVDGYHLALTRENTLASFILAGRSGADFVEFDVQLTKDRVPVIYHDFMVSVGLEDKGAQSFGTKSETYEIGIHDMSLRQLTQSYTTPVPHKGGKSQEFQKRVKKHWTRLQGDKKVPSPRHALLSRDDDNAKEEGHLVDFFPRLEDLLKHVPAEVGLNIEIKYPDNFFRPGMRSLSCFAINAYLDRVLECVFDYAGPRRIFFSCFDPSVCIALRAKQTKYPVLFLTYGSMALHAMDARMTLQFATNFAKMEKLQGIVSNSDSFIDTPELAPLVKKALGTVLITWGDQNTNHEMVQLQKRHAIDGVISDNVIDLINQDKKLQALAK
ncbi:hypothetical protein PF010_g12306 [Phytophthora fragariae]|uniref:Glycerophosphocholine phosphodiesterase n=1 Tax=Phytophthora fragariae TaxID=53985 RepID=A0A6G0L3Y2_9STRA|nr:hypothetical protein PF010_g12306 [Phytophthora fragariae]